MFPQGIIIHKGKLAERVTQPKKTAIYNVSLLSDDNLYPRLRAIECNDQLLPNCLNSNHTFVIIGNSTPAHVSKKNKTSVYVWQGKYSPQEEFKYGKEVAERLIAFNKKIRTLCDVYEMQEGKEHEELFKALECSPDAVKKALQLPGNAKRQHDAAKCFLFVGATGVVTPERLYNWNQDDLETTGVYMIDTHERVYLWFSVMSTFLEHKVTIESAVEYVKKDAKGRPANPEQSIFITLPLEEPLEFTSCFQCWGDFRHRTYIDLLKTKKNANKTLLNAMEKLKDFQRQVYSYEDLLSENYGPNVDKTKLDTYLSDEEFEQVFKMPREEFLKLPEWKQGKLKHEVYLF